MTDAPDSAEAPALYTVAEAARRLAVSPSTVGALIRSGELPSRRIGRALRVPREAVERVAREGAST